MVEILKQLNNQIIPESYPEILIKDIDIVKKYRQEIIFLQGFSLVSMEWITPLANWIGKRKCLEIMAGLGTISFALKQCGVNVISTDDYSWGSWINNSIKWTEVEKLDYIDSIEKYGKYVDFIIMSWCYLDNNGWLALKKMRKVNPDCLMIFIGDHKGGLIGSDMLYENMIVVPDKEIEKINLLYPTWHNINDHIYLIK